jgi:phasin family protein
MFMLPPKLFGEWPAEWPAALPTALPAAVPAAFPPELVNISRELAESQLAGCNALVRAAFESGASLLALNVDATRDGIAAANAVSNQLLFVREARDLVCLTASQSQQALERAQRYGRQVAGVANTAQQRIGELSRDFAGGLPRNPIE